MRLMIQTKIQCYGFTKQLNLHLAKSPILNLFPIEKYKHTFQSSGLAPTAWEFTQADTSVIKTEKNTPSNERLFQSCKAGVIDSELHLFTNCQTHTLERNILKNSILRKSENT